VEALVMFEVEQFTTNETEFREILGFDGYRVGDDGTVWSCRAFSRWESETNEWHRLKPQLRRGYLRVGLTRNGKLHWRSVHRLVLEAFVGTCLPGMEACHNDGNRLNNRLDNLRWDTPVANAQDKHRHGRTARGSRAGRAKLTEGDIPVVRRLRAEGASYGEIAALCGLTRATVIALLKGRTWNHV
jgi:hypothetical protein